MGLQPLDLQTMYSQLANVAKVASGAEHAVQAAQNAEQKNTVKQLEEQKHKVQEADKQSGTSSVNQNGHNNPAFSDKKNGKKDDNKQDEKNDSSYRLKESYLGQHVDITR